MSTDPSVESTNASESPEQRFLNFARTGNKAIIQMLITEFADRSYTQARRIIGRKDGAEDAVQDAYLRLVHTAKKYDGSVPFAAWLGRLIHAAAINYRERRLSRQINLSDMSDQGAAAMNQQLTATDSPDSPEVEALRTALDTLPERYRTPLTLYYFGGLNQNETAQALGAPLGTIASYLARGLEQLREKLGRSGSAMTSAGLLAMLANLPAYAASPALKTSLIASERLMAAGRDISPHLLGAKKISLLQNIGIVIVKAGVIGALIAGAALVVSVYRPYMPSASPDSHIAPTSSEPGLIARWTFDEGQGSSAVSTVGNTNANAGSLVNRPTWTSGKIGGALTFDGTNYVSVPSAPILNSITNQLTVAAWIYKRADAPIYGAIVGRRLGTGTDDIWVLFYDSDFHNTELIRRTDQAYALTVTTSNGKHNIAGPSSATDLNTWVHIVATYDGARLGLYRNGALVASGPCTGTFASENTPVVIGAGDGGTYGIEEFINATVDDVRIYNRALTDAEIRDMYPGLK